jgi:hypothetical protein
MNVTYCRCGHVEDNDQHACPVTHERLRGNLSLAEEGLANYQQENKRLRDELTACQLERDIISARCVALATSIYGKPEELLAQIKSAQKDG